MASRAFPLFSTISPPVQSLSPNLVEGPETVLKEREHGKPGSLALAVRDRAGHALPFSPRPVS